MKILTSLLDTFSTSRTSAFSPTRRQLAGWIGSAGLLTLAACGGGGSDSPPLAPTDARNGSYTAYATNGERFTLTVDFNSKQYNFKGLTVPTFTAAGALTSDTMAGTQVFQPPPGAGATARFRYVDDLIVGSYNFTGGVQPFVASRRFAKNTQEAAGVYNNLGVSRTVAGVDDSAIYTSRLSVDGGLQVCVDNIIYTIDKCPLASVRSYALAMVDGETFTATPAPATGGDSFNFRIAQAGTDKVYLMAAVGLVTGTRYFRIGTLEPTAFGAGAAYGGSVLGEWGVANYTPLSYSSMGVSLTGTPLSLSGSLAGLGSNGPIGIRSLEAAKAFVMQSTQLGVLVGARNNASTGYMQIGAK